ncbi:MAG: hypothetical protein IJX47_02250 [Clostridia bacterium]|nr:hypothetical protein [Clostridia bacterium]
MKKKILATALAMLLTAPLLLSGCSEQDPNAPDGYKLASNDNVEYHLFVPKDWIVDTAEDNLMTAARVSDVINTNISMIAYTNDTYEVKKDEKGNSISPVPEYWSDYKADLERIFDLDDEGKTTFALSEDLSGKTCLIGGNSESGKTATGYTYVYTGKIGGTELKYMQVIIFQKETFYLLTYTSVPSQYDEYVDEVEEILTYIELP